MLRTLGTLLVLTVCAAVHAEEGYTTLTAPEAQAETQPAAESTPASASADAQPAPEAQTPPAAGQAPPPVIIAPSNVCASVTCSGHGVCQESAGRAVCACEGGYMPAGNDGLSCVPYTPPVAVVHTPAVADDPERKAALDEFAAVLPGFPAYRYYRKYARLKKMGRADGNFADYMVNKFQGKKGGGIAMIAVGVVLTGAAAAFLTVGINADSIWSCYDDDDYYDDYYDDGCNDGRQAVFIVFGSLFSAASVTMYAIGIPKLVVSGARAKKIKPLSEKHASLPAISDFKLSFLNDKKTSSYGLGAGFRF